MIHVYRHEWNYAFTKYQNFYRENAVFQVESVSKKEKVKQRPLALNTVEMLRVASAALGRYKSSDFHTVLKQNILASQNK